MLHKILIADPELGMARTLAAALEQAGYQVSTTSDGEEALAMSTAEQPDLICVEVHLPRLGGLEVCKAIKAARQVPVLVTTSYLDDAISSGFTNAGADQLLFKPFSPDELIDTVAWYLEPTE
jgi:DNA-binding response OmpR family regulator